jgi:hypothetical protein
MGSSAPKKLTETSVRDTKETEITIFPPLREEAKIFE